VAGIGGSFIGLVVGGLLAEWHWRAVFWVSVPVGIWGTWMGYRTLRDKPRDPNRKVAIDWWGNLTFGVGLIAILIAITYGLQPYGGHTMGWTSPKVLTGLIGGLLLLVVFGFIEVRVNEKVSANFQMEVGGINESVTVTAESPLIDETTADRGGILDNVRISELPVIGRNPINYINLVPGVVFNGNQQFQRPFDNGDNINFSINGGLQQTNNFLIDGQPDNAITDTTTDRTRGVNNIAYIPTNDAVQEFRVMTNFYDAQYGRTGGGVVNIATKSGANAFHGSAYEFLRRYQLDANNVNANAAGIPRYTTDPATGKNLGGHELDQYGTVLSGPVILPHVYNGREKTFWMFGLNLRAVMPVILVPTPPRYLALPRCVTWLPNDVFLPVK